MFEVEPEDCFSENLNESFVVPEDFNMYRKLVRPNAEGIFVYLYLWFYPSQGKEVEKDYTELCALLNVRSYEHVSKIRETMGLSLSDLVNIGYLKNWDIRPMSSKTGYKLVLTPGRANEEVLSITQRKQRAFAAAHTEVPLSDHCELARVALIRQGISEIKATELAKKLDPSTLLEQIEYVVWQIAEGGRTLNQKSDRISHHVCEGRQQVPPPFKMKRQLQLEERRRLEVEAERAVERNRTFARMQIEDEYKKWGLAQADVLIAREFGGDRLIEQLKRVSSRLRKDPVLAASLDRTTNDTRAEQLRRAHKRVMEEMALPTLKEWGTLIRKRSVLALKPPNTEVHFRATNVV